MGYNSVFDLAFRSQDAGLPDDYGKERVFLVTWVDFCQTVGKSLENTVQASVKILL